MFLDAFAFIISGFTSVIGWFFAYQIQPGVTFGGIFLVTVIISALFMVVASIFEISGYVGTAADRAEPGVRKVKLGAKKLQKRAAKWK
jgi:ABC-type Fe3+-siderophore transport system permease subunit